MSVHNPSTIFTCTTCGDCCRGFGGTFVTNADINAIAAYIGTMPEDFLRKYCQMSGNMPVLAQGRNGYCIFWNKLCAIHPVKPRMCKAWPFIESVRIDVANWHIMAASCPGMRTDVPDNIIKECVEKELNDSHSSRLTHHVSRIL